MTSSPGEASEFISSPCVERRHLEDCGELKDGKDVPNLLQRWYVVDKQRSEMYGAFP